MRDDLIVKTCIACGKCDVFWPAGETLDCICNQCMDAYTHELRAEHRTLVEAVRRKVSPVPCTCGMAGVSPCNRCSILLLLPPTNKRKGR